MNEKLERIANEIGGMCQVYMVERRFCVFAFYNERCEEHLEQRKGRERKAEKWKKSHM